MQRSPAPQDPLGRRLSFLAFLSIGGDERGGSLSRTVRNTATDCTCQYCHGLAAGPSTSVAAEPSRLDDRLPHVQAGSDAAGPTRGCGRLPCTGCPAEIARGAARWGPTRGRGNTVMRSSWQYCARFARGPHRVALLRTFGRGSSGRSLPTRRSPMRRTAR
jgi:hypothetical protein